MKILRNYILKESIIPFFLSLSVLTSVFLLGNLINLTDLVINRGVNLLLIGKVFFYYIPFFLTYTLPIACLVAVILSFSRFSADNEVLAMRASGIHLKKLLLPISIVGILLSLFSLILNARIVPHAYHQQRRLVRKVGTQNPAALLEAGTFITAFRNQIIFIYRIEGNKLYNVRIYQPQPSGRMTRTITAQRGEFTQVPGENKIKLKLMNGTSDEPDLENPNNFYKLRFNTFFKTLDLSGDSEDIEKRPKAMTLSELSDQIQEYRSLDIDTTPLKTEYHRKTSWSFSILVFILLGFPLAVVTHKRAKTANVTLAMICGAIYYLLTLGFEALSAQGTLPVALAMWTPNILGFFIASILNYRICVS